MTPAKFSKIGEKLHGQHWKAPLARALDVHRHLTARWGSGESRIPAPVKILMRIWDENQRKAKNQKRHV